MKWCFENSALEDLANISFYEMRYAESVDEACLRADHIIDDIVYEVSTLPERFAERAYGFTDALRRLCPAGKYVVFYWIDEESGTVQERVVYAKSDFNRIHFGN